MPDSLAKYSHHIPNTVSSPPDRRGGQVGQDGVLLQGRLDGQGRGEHALAQHDQGEQAVALGDVARVPGGGGGRSAQTGTASSPATRTRKPA